MFSALIVVRKFKKVNSVDDEILYFVRSSHLRFYALKAIGTGFKTPSQIADDACIRLNHISNVLRDLKNKGLVECINPEASKGRLYRLTDLGLLVLENFY